MITDSPDPQISGIPSTSRPETSGIQPSSHHVTVLRAHDLPFHGKRRRCYATVSDGARTWRTPSVKSVGNRVEWSGNVDAFAVQPHSDITISLYVKRTFRKDTLVGMKEIACESCEPQREHDVPLCSAHAGHASELASPYLTITVSINSNSSMTAAVSIPDPATTNVDNPVVERGAAPPNVPASAEPMQSTAVTIPLPPLSGDPPIESSTPVGPVADGQTDMSRSLDRAEEAMDTVKTWKSTVETIKQVMDIVSPIVKLNSQASSAWTLLSKIPETLLQQFKRDDNVRTLLTAIRDAFEFAKEADILRSIQPESKQAKILDEMLQCVSGCAEFIESYAKDAAVVTRTMKNIAHRVDGKVEDYSSTLARLRQEFLAHATVTIEAAVLQTQVDVRNVNTQLTEVSNLALEAELNAIIREIPYKGGWRFGDERRCLPGTRVAFLDYIAKWINNPGSERGLVLLGQAGMGKSSIAHEVARRFDKKCLGSNFAFMRKEQSKDEAYQLFTTLARDLADRHPIFKHALGRVIKDDSSLRSTRDYRILFDCLLLESLKNLPLPSPILIIIDALDESGAAIGKNGLHTFLAQRLVDLPANFRVLITSRLENGIEHAFANARSIRTLYMDDAELAANTEQDIGVYLRNELPEEVFKEHGEKLAKAAEGLFQWVAVASGFINGRASRGINKKKRVQRLLGHSQDRNREGLLDGLYEEVLKEYFKSEEAQVLFRSIMGQLLASIEPLSIETLIGLRRHAPVDDPEDSDPLLILEVLGDLGSLLSNVTSSDQTRPIVPLHTSFRDFLTNKASNVFYVDLADSHHQLAHSCLGLMLNNLKFNICKLESSYLANCDVPDLETRIAKHVGPALSYACIYWGDHLQQLAFDYDIFKELRSLFETKFLFWLEVLSVKDRVGTASQRLSYMLMWLQRESQQSLQTEVKNLSSFVKDASAFVRYFGMAVARSAPHIYVSALPFTPTSSRVLNQFIHQFPHMLSFERGRLSHWPALEMTIQAHDDMVQSVIFSPDGQRIASASNDCTVRLWDATTGQAVAGPFTGHTNVVFSVAFSPDGQRIASASRDWTIRVWDATTGRVIADPFTGHTNAVYSVAFSPDGQRIASASFDRTIRVWDATTGQVVAGPFTGHTNSVYSVVFSPDGQRIASASSDRTIRVWDATTGQVVAGPFTGHTGEVYSVAFSPGGQRIASASSDRTIRVWDAATGQVLADPFTGHTNSVHSVAFSPDGQHIASASKDRTICIWDATTGQVVTGPFTGHTYVVYSVAFSPDGQRIASASSDRTIRLWDATTGPTVAGSFTGHTDGVYSVAFSPDGQRIASASYDRMIRVWDATTGQVVAGPFTGHTDVVFSVAFSPDGRRIASASYDRTIRVWDATTGQVVAGPFTGHTDGVYSVAFSPNGQHIASASKDHTICVWDATTGQVVTGPFTGHASMVHSAAFSLDRQRIASGSRDRTIRVRDAMTGRAVARPFTRHIDFVSFSLDEQRIVSAPDDPRIRMWATTAQAVTGPFTGHTNSVYSVAFSPDGKRIASASHDCTIRMWDATTGQAVTRRFTGHTSVVYSVAFSPDGQRIASASHDHTICLWDSRRRRIVAGPFKGHTKAVRHVAFSPDGQCIASASEDRTIRVWDATTGQVVAGPFTGHTDCVHSAAFSPDGQRIASASTDRTIRVWDTTTGQAVAGLFLGHTNRTVSTSDDCKIHVRKVIMEDTEKIHFTDQTLINNDGWIYGEENELFLWIPAHHRSSLHRPSTVWVAGEHETRLDFSKFVHGSNWATIYDHHSTSS